MINNNIYFEIEPSDFSLFDSSKITVFTVFTLSRGYRFRYQTYFDMFLKSILVSNKNEDINLFVIMNSGSSFCIKNTINKYADLVKQSKINIYLLKDDLFKKYSKQLYVIGWSDVIFYRLFLCYMFTNIHKVLYLDVDTLTAVPLSIYNKFNIDDYLFYGFKDIDDEVTDCIVLNSGVLLMNFDKIREKYKVPEDLIKRYKDYACGQDQDFINTDKTHVVNDLTYNFPCIYSRFLNHFINNKLIRQKLANMAKNAKVFHFYPKEDYHAFGDIFDIMKENNPVFKECFIEDVFKKIS